ncbi:hypothetical protein PIB30_100583, partial [Stylosanthes scabra]|nr:hypothetical protein [Stylosanthes scabra]
MAKNKQYVVFDGRNPGIYDSWDDANAQVSGFPRNSFKSFKTPQEAQDAWNNTSPETTAVEDKLSDLTISPQ